MQIRDVITKHPSITQHDVLAEICKPLKKLNIIYFAHVNVDKKNHMSAICLCPKFFTEYLKNHFQDYDLHQANLNDFYPYIMWDMFKTTPNTNTRNMQNIFAQCNYGHTFSIIKNLAGEKNYYHFATKVGNDSINNNYLNMLEELYGFINYFTDKIQRSKDLKLSYQIKIPINCRSGEFSYQYNLNQRILMDFHQDVNIERFYFNHYQYLTAKEMQCLYWVAQGKTEEEISIILQISKRTVKEHIKNIKIKLNSKTLFQLGMMYYKLTANKQNIINNLIA